MHANELGHGLGPEHGSGLGHGLGNRLGLGHGLGLGQGLGRRGDNLCDGRKGQTWVRGERGRGNTLCGGAG